MDIGLNSIFPELSQIDFFVDSEEKLDPIVDKEIGVLPDCLKGFYTLVAITKRKAKENFVMNIADDESIIKFHYEKILIIQKYEFLKEVFRILVYESFGFSEEEGHPPIGVREGFVAVKPANYRSVKPVIKREGPVIIVLHQEGENIDERRN